MPCPLPPSIGVDIYRDSCRPSLDGFSSLLKSPPRRGSVRLPATATRCRGRFRRSPAGVLRLNSRTHVFFHRRKKRIPGASTGTRSRGNFRQRTLEGGTRALSWMRVCTASPQHLLTGNGLAFEKADLAPPISVDVVLRLECRRLSIGCTTLATRENWSTPVTCAARPGAATLPQRSFDLTRNQAVGTYESRRCGGLPLRKSARCFRRRVRWVDEARRSARSLSGKA